MFLSSRTPSIINFEIFNSLISLKNNLLISCGQAFYFQVIFFYPAPTGVVCVYLLFFKLPILKIKIACIKETLLKVCEAMN